MHSKSTQTYKVCIGSNDHDKTQKMLMHVLVYQIAIKQRKCTSSPLHKTTQIVWRSSILLIHIFYGTKVIHYIKRRVVQLVQKVHW